jgi:DNA repair exonuclease SbcCD ATPase subunit
LLRRIRGASSVEDERERLRQAQESAARQLEAMKHELRERVQAVRDRERQLEEALTGAPSPPVVSLPRIDGDAATMAERERAVRTREEMLARREQELAPIPPDTGDARNERALIERRLAELREAEKLFLRTQSELASRSETVAARERLLASRERALGDGDRSDGSELAELEARLRRLERESAPAAGEDRGSFAGGLESLRRRGTRRQR